MSKRYISKRILVRARLILLSLEKQRKLGDELAELRREEGMFRYYQDRTEEIEKKVEMKRYLAKCYRGVWFNRIAVGVGAFLLVAISSYYFRLLILRE